MGIGDLLFHIYQADRPRHPSGLSVRPIAAWLVPKLVIEIVIWTEPITRHWRMLENRTHGPIPTDDQGRSGKP